MSTPASELIQQAFREGNIIPVGKSPSADQQAEGLVILNRLLRATFGFLMGENLRTWQVPATQRVGAVAANPPLAPGSATPRELPNNTYPSENSMLVWDGSSQTVYFPEKPTDGARMAFTKASGAAAAGAGALVLDGNGRTIEGVNTYTTSTVTERQWFYRADLADWKALAVLALAETCPFPSELDDMWTCGVSMRLAPRYGKTVHAGTMEAYHLAASKFRTQYQQTSPGAGSHEIQNSRQSYVSSRTGTWMGL